jgi:hypothetical protein
MDILGDKPLNVIVPAVLFVLLQPGFLLSLNLFGLNPVLTHAVVMMVVYTILRKVFANMY